MRRLRADPLGLAILLVVVAMCAAVIVVRLPHGRADDQTARASGVLAVALLLLSRRAGERSSVDPENAEPRASHGAVHASSGSR